MTDNSKLHELVLRTMKFLELEENWDSYGSAPINRWCIRDAIRILFELNTFYPSVVPTNIGGVKLEWHTQGKDIEVEIHPTDFHVYVLFPDGTQTGYGRRSFRGMVTDIENCLMIPSNELVQAQKLEEILKG